jgi:sugar phosphate isomerase/epimerase
MYKLAVFTDEITQDLDRALMIAKEFNCEGVEIRSVWDTGVHKLTDAQVSDIRKKCDDQGLAVCCLGSPFYKCELENPQEIQEHHEHLRRCCEVAHKLGTDLIRGFTFWRRGPVEPVWDRIVDHFTIPVQIVEAGNCRLVIENEASTYLGTGAQVASFLDEIGNPHLAAVWDPCNVIFDFDNQEIPYPDGYRALKKHIVHVHLKDAERISPSEARCVRIGEGQIDYTGQFKAFLADGYKGYLSLETHWRPVDITKEMMDRPGGASYSQNAEYASCKCLESIQQLLAEAKAGAVA